LFQIRTNTHHGSFGTKGLFRRFYRVAVVNTLYPYGYQDARR